MEFIEKGHHNRTAEINAMVDAGEGQCFYQYAAKSSNLAIDALSTSVRPVLKAMPFSFFDQEPF